MLTGQQKIANLAKQAHDMSFTSINQYLDTELLDIAFLKTRKDGAVGVDGQTWADYAINLGSNLKSLVTRAKNGSYFAPPVKRIYIPKGPNTKEVRPLGIPTLEDKLLQRGISMLLEPIYEQDFYNCSYGFRPGRSQHMALEALRDQVMRLNGAWIIDVDVRKFFDTLDHSCLRELLQIRVRDGMVRKLIDKWLNAGIFEKEKISYNEMGSPQGSSISPLLSNIYLHYVLDEWVHKQVIPWARGHISMVRFADDFLIVCESKHEAEKILETLSKRFAKFGLTIHPEKTRLIDFTNSHREEDYPTTFDFLGFTFYWGKSRRGKMVTKYKTAKKRLGRAIQNITSWCKENRHKPVKEQHEKLKSKLQGHYNYYGVTGNLRSLHKVFHETKAAWKKWLSRRSQRYRMNWRKFSRILERYPLPIPKIAHSYIK